MRALPAFLLLGFSTLTAAIPTNVTFQSFFTGVTFARPLYFAEVPGRDSNYVVLEQQKGLASVVHRKSGVWVKDTLVKINAVTSDGNLGMLGFAFHPNFTTNRKYYIYYSSTTTTNVVDEFQADTSLIKDAGVTPRRLISFGGRNNNMNNGGNLVFGPADGYLYIGVGDGGSANGDAANVSQNGLNMLGKVLRIDVNSQPGGNPYAIPADNPFVGNAAYNPEIYAYGVRQPWRFSFDALTKNLWAGEVGESTREEVDTIPKGANMGWRQVEGSSCQPNVTCSTTGTVLPLFTYGHTGGDVAVIGGYVYRANPASPFYGAYFFGDYGSGRVRAIKVVNGVTQDSAVMTATVAGLSSFGMDSKGALYATSVNTNLVYRLTSADFQPVSVRFSDRKIGKADPALGLLSGKNGVSGLDLRDLQGKRIAGKAMGTGIYVIKNAGNIPALVPVFK